MAELIRVSYSSLRTFQTCPRMYYWSYVRRLKPVGRQVALEFGSAWHAGLSALFKTQALNPAIDTFNAHFEDTRDDAMRTQATAKRMLTRYAEKYPFDDLTLVADERWLEVPIAGQALYVMKIDKLLTWHDEPIIMEHKTTSGYAGISAGYLKQFRPSLQLRGYTYGVQTLINSAYRKVLVDIAWVGKGEPKSGEGFLRYEEPIEGWELKEFEELVPKLATQIAWREDKFENFEPNWSMCTQYGECAYRRLCSAAPSIREREIAEAYEVKPVREEEGT